MSGGQLSHTPRDAKVMAAILKDVGVEDYEPRIINQMLEFAYRYVSDVLDDARVYSEFSGKKSVDADDVRLSVQMKVENTLTTPPSRELLAELAQEKNAIPLPALKQQYGLRLPPDRYCTLQPNFRLKPPSGPPAPIGVRAGSVSGGMPGTISQPAMIRIPQPPRPKPVETPPGVPKAAKPAVIGDQPPTGGVSTKPSTSMGQAKPLFRLVSGSAAARPATTSSSGDAQTASGGVKRKLEPLDEDYDQI